MYKVVNISFTLEHLEWYNIDNGDRLLLQTHLLTMAKVQ